MVMAKARAMGVVNGADLMTRFHDIQYTQSRRGIVWQFSVFGAIYMALVLLYICPYSYIYLYNPQISHNLFMRKSYHLISH